VSFRTLAGRAVPSVTGAEMREVDRVAVERFGLGILQMMENAGSCLAEITMNMLGDGGRRVVVLAGAGGNGGGGLCSARHLHNNGVEVEIVLDRAPDALGSPAAAQLRILDSAGMTPLETGEAAKAIQNASIVVDSLIGYGLKGRPEGRTAELIGLVAECGKRVVSLDVPPGVDATTGEATGDFVSPERTVTLALPKAGLSNLAGELYLADIGIPLEVYSSLGIRVEPFFDGARWIRILAAGRDDSPGRVSGNRYREEQSQG